MIKKLISKSQILYDAIYAVFLKLTEMEDKFVAMGMEMALGRWE